MNGIAIALSGCARFQCRSFGSVTTPSTRPVSGSATMSGSWPCAPARTHETGIHVVSTLTRASSSIFESLYASSFVTSAILSYGPRTISTSDAMSSGVQPTGSCGPAGGASVIGGACSPGAPAG